MKHILPILTAALALTASTASAALNYDYSYYERAEIGTPTTDGVVADTFSRKYAVQSLDYGSYQVVKEGTYIQNGKLTYQSLYKVKVVGTSVDFYLADVVDNIGSETDSSALADRGITQIGYHVLASNTAEKVDKKVFSSLADSLEKTVDGSFVYAGQTVTANRNIYYLGTFNAGDEFEVYMSRDLIGENGPAEGETGVWSYTTNESRDAHGGYYGGNFQLPYVQTDQWVLSEKNGDAAKANLAMPLASLDPGIPSGSAINGSRASFSIYAVGSPLPGGLQIALIAGLFGLGFYYVRRRKAMAA